MLRNDGGDARVERKNKNRYKNKGSGQGKEESMAVMLKALLLIQYTF
jgi:hypothetical protein